MHNEHVHYLAIATVTTFPGAHTVKQESFTSSPDSDMRVHGTVPSSGEHGKKINWHNVIFGMQTLYKYNIIGF